MRVLLTLAFLALAARGTLAETPPTLRDLAFLAGTWTAWQDGEFVEEHWTAPRGTTLLGMNRTVRGDDKTSFEFLRIEQRPDGLVYVAQPAGRPGVEFQLVRLHGQEVVFENRQHDWPQRIAYWIDEHGGLAANASGPGADGKPVALEWHWRRAAR